MKTRESSDPYYDLAEDFGLIVSSFQSQYGIRLSKELDGMKWSEFKDLLTGLSPDTAIRSEEDKKILENFTKEQRKIRAEWRSRHAKKITKEAYEDVLEQIKNAFLAIAGGG